MIKGQNQTTHMLKIRCFLCRAIIIYALWLPIKIQLPPHVPRPRKQVKLVQVTAINEMNWETTKGLSLGCPLLDKLVVNPHNAQAGITKLVLFSQEPEVETEGFFFNKSRGIFFFEKCKGRVEKLKILYHRRGKVFSRKKGKVGKP